MGNEDYGSSCIRALVHAGRRVRRARAEHRGSYYCEDVTEPNLIMEHFILAIRWVVNYACREFRF